jgi:hypothetical protein
LFIASNITALYIKITIISAPVFILIIGTPPRPDAFSFLL